MFVFSSKNILLLELGSSISNSIIPLIDKNSIVVIIKVEQMLILTIVLIKIMLTVWLSTIVSLY